jgi:hypothetical protein
MQHSGSGLSSSILGLVGNYLDRPYTSSYTWSITEMVLSRWKLIEDSSGITYSNYDSHRALQTDDLNY